MVNENSQWLEINSQLSQSFDPHFFTDFFISLADVSNLISLIVSLHTFASFIPNPHQGLQNPMRTQ